MYRDTVPKPPKGGGSATQELKSLTVQEFREETLLLIVHC